MNYEICNGNNSSIILIFVPKLSGAPPRLINQMVPSSTLFCSVSWWSSRTSEHRMAWRPGHLSFLCLFSHNLSMSFHRHGADIPFIKCRRREQKQQQVHPTALTSWKVCPRLCDAVWLCRNQTAPFTRELRLLFANEQTRLLTFTLLNGAVFFKLAQIALKVTERGPIWRQ